MALPITALHALQASDYLRLTNDDYLNCTYSQSGEDRFIMSLLQQLNGIDNHGIYVDVGCFHPRKYSNTKILNVCGWQGINVDANPETIKLFNEDRPNDRNVLSGVCGSNRTPEALTYYHFHLPAANTFSEEIAQRWQKEKGWQIVGTEQIMVRPFNDVLEEHIRPGETIDLLDIDIEGFDYEVIHSFNFAKYRPKILSLELHNTNPYQLGDDATVKFLREHRYELQSLSYGGSYIFYDATIPRSTV